MRKIAVFMAVALAGGVVQADLLYNIASFNNNGTIASQWWVPGITTITVFPGLTGTDDAGLVSLQSMNPDPANDTGGGDRFQNASSENVARGTVTTDVAGQGAGGPLGQPAGDGYFQFGIAGGAGFIGLESLTFDGVQATGSPQGRGYNIEMQIDGGGFNALASGTFNNARPQGLENINIPLAATGASSVDFRVRATGGGIEWTNFAINGVVPEPSTLALFGLAGLVLAFRRRK